VREKKTNKQTNEHTNKQNNNTRGEKWANVYKYTNKIDRWQYGCIYISRI